MIRRILAGALLCAAPAFAQVPTAGETIEVTATRIAEDVSLVPASITIVNGNQLRARNVTDLARALSLVAGVSAVGGSDSGPAAGVPEMWGLREVDAFLLVVDGIPWGGAFNPDLPSVDLTGVDRIEIVRGSAPVVYGATSFVGVIHVIHREAGAPGDARVSLGSYGSGAIAATLPLSTSSGMRQSVLANVERRGYDDDRTQYDRAHALYRLAFGNYHLDADASLIRQDPSSPHPRQGPSLSALVPIGANHNPRDARLDENRIQLSGGWSTPQAAVTLAVVRSTFDIQRGFLRSISNTSPNAVGFSQDRTVTDVYADAHRVWQPRTNVRVIAGIDHLFGTADVENDLFDYSVPLSGHNASAPGVSDEHHELEDERNFSGAYATAEWTPRPRLRFDAGLRLNHTSERRDAEGDHDTRTVTRPGGSVGVTWQAVQGASSALSFFADYRNTFKPAALDFGPEAEADILEVEEAESWEVGAKGALLGERFRWQSSVFRMNFSNLVLPTVRNGLPTIENAGHERFMGFETELQWNLGGAVDFDFAYGYHDARFRDYVRDFDGVPTQLSGRRFEMSPLHNVAAALVYAPEHGWNGNVEMNYAGERYLTKRNTARAEPYTIWSAGIGREIGRGELRVDGRNLFDKRPPVSESELGDAQYYRLAARSVELSYRMKL